MNFKYNFSFSLIIFNNNIKINDIKELENNKIIDINNKQNK